MGTVTIVKRIGNLIIPEPTQLWSADAATKKRMVIEAKSSWALFRASYGFKVPTNVGSLVFGTAPDGNQKFGKSRELVFGLSLSQANTSGYNVCHWSTAECRRACVGKNGNNGFDATMRAKVAKTRFLFEHPREAGILLADFWEKADRTGIAYRRRTHRKMDVGGRLNTYSDLDWVSAAPWIFERFSKIRFYDYTKQWDRVSPFDNYHLTYSASERTCDEQIVEKLVDGKNVAVVFSDWRSLPSEYLGFPVVDGDKDDTRWKDPPGSIVGLRRKGSLRADSPMVRKI